MKAEKKSAKKDCIEAVYCRDLMTEKGETDAEGEDNRLYLAVVQVRLGNGEKHYIY